MLYITFWTLDELITDLMDGSFGHDHLCITVIWIFGHDWWMTMAR